MSDETRLSTGAAVIVQRLPQPHPDGWAAYLTLDRAPAALTVSLAEADLEALSTLAAEPCGAARAGLTARLVAAFHLPAGRQPTTADWRAIGRIAAVALSAPQRSHAEQRRQREMAFALAMHAGRTVA
ncbi:MAG TPA: hypothetical protein VF041_23215 [Gemmatimonadaceae bacterium]